MRELLNATLSATLSNYVRDPASAWVCGGFGALAEFTFDAGEKIEFLDGDCLGAEIGRAHV